MIASSRHRTAMSDYKHLILTNMRKIKDSEWLAGRLKSGVKGTQIFFIGIALVVGYFVLQVIGLSSVAAIAVLALLGGLISIAKKS